MPNSTAEREFWLFLPAERETTQGRQMLGRLKLGENQSERVQRNEKWSMTGEKLGLEAN